MTGLRGLAVLSRLVRVAENKCSERVKEING